MQRIRRWAIAAVALLGVIVVDDIIKIVALDRRLSIVNKALVDIDSVSFEAARRSDEFVQSAEVFYLLALVAAGVTFIVWMSLMAKAAAQTRPDALRHSTGWAVGAWFVPFLNLVRPPQIVNDIWAANRPDNELRANSALVGWWWGIYLFPMPSSGSRARPSTRMTGSARCVTGHDGRWWASCSTSSRPRWRSPCWSR